MTTMELNAELLHELSTIATDENLLRKAINAIKALKQEKVHTEMPCCYSAEEMKKRVVDAVNRHAKGDYISNEEMKARTNRWK